MTTASKTLPKKSVFSTAESRAEAKAVRRKSLDIQRKKNYKGWQKVIRGEF